MSNILKQIVEQKKLDLQVQKTHLPLKEIQKQNLNFAIPSFYEALNENKTNIIAEIKRFSPSKGALRPDLNPIELATEYAFNGACAISVLTEEKFFKGSSEDLKQVKSQINIPILRKDFIIDEYQIWSARLIGASAILLIAAILSETEIINFSKLAHELGLDVLVEVHNAEETQKALKSKPKILGVNNRNLQNFEVNLDISFNLIKQFQNADCRLWVSESGIYEKAQITQLQKAGFKAFLIGETLLKAQSPAQKLKELL